MNKRKNILLGISATLLFLALFDGWEYGFFTLLRFVVCVCCAYAAFLASKNEKWMWCFIFIAVLFNPLIPMRFSRDVWKFIDLVTGVSLVVGMILFNPDKTANKRTP